MPGVVYTKAWVVRLMLDMVGYVEHADLADGVAVEPSCGCGAFLSEMVPRLIASAKSRGKFTREGIVGSLRAYDVDVDAVRRSRAVASGLLREAGMNEKDASAIAIAWISVGDTLLAELPDADWVVGNPPYVRSSQIDYEKRVEYAKRLDCVTMGTDLYVGFYEIGLRSLKESGRLCFICSDRWLQNRYGSRLRSMVADGFSVRTHIRMHGADVFEETVSAYPAITLIERGLSDLCYVDCSAGFSENDVCDLMNSIGEYEVETPQFELVHMPKHGNGEVFPLASPKRVKLVSEIEQSFPLLEEAGVRIGIGIASGRDDVFITNDDELVERDRLLPLFYMRDHRKGLPQMRYLVNPWGADGRLVDLRKYPKLRRYLTEHQAVLQARHTAASHPSEWYRTLDKPNRALMGEPMLLFPDMASSSDPVMSDGSRYPHHNCYWLTSSEWDLRALGGLLMSDIVEAFIDAYGVKMRGKTLRFQAQYLRMVRVPRFESVPKSVVEELADAFERRDRNAASRVARKAYRLKEGQ